MDGARRWDLVGALAGAALGIADYALLAAPPEGPLASREAVAVGFISSLALVGFFAGRLVMARARARFDAAVIVPDSAMHCGMRGSSQAIASPC